MGQDTSSLSYLESKIGYTFTRKELLKQALTHGSLSTHKNYQRLEFLGDSVIQMVITDYLFRRHSTLSEGHLTQLRANLVCKQKQSEIATELELLKFIQMSSSLQRNTERFSRQDQFVESLIGAVYLDAGGDGDGYDKVKDVVYKMYGFPRTGIISYYYNCIKKNMISISIVCLSIIVMSFTLNNPTAASVAMEC